MFVNVETLFLNPFVDTYAHRFVYQEEEHYGDDGRERDAEHGGDELNPELMPVAIQRALLIQRWFWLLMDILFYVQH